jgi:hypothetical protein
MTYSGNDAILLPGGKRTFTSEGNLIAPAVLARSGILPYYARELGLTDRSPNALVKVFRSPETLAQSAPTFEAKPITVDHPPQGVDATSWRKLADPRSLKTGVIVTLYCRTGSSRGKRTCFDCG